MNATHPIHRTLRIRQQNLNKSPVAFSHLISTNLPKDWDIILIQEPHLDKLELTKASGG